VKLDGDGARFVRWLEGRVIKAARGDDLVTLSVEPSGKLWLGRLTSEAAVISSGLGDRGERLDPCAIGIRTRPKGTGPWRSVVHVRACVWRHAADGTWHKTPHIDVSIPVEASAQHTEDVFGATELSASLARTTGATGLCAEVRTVVEADPDGRAELIITLVNTSPEDHKDFRDTNLYECELRLEGLDAEPFVLDSLPDSFRYDRRIPAYGINCGVECEPQGSFKTADVIDADQPRRSYWGSSDPVPDLSFNALADDPLPSLRALLSSLRSWGAEAWGTRALERRGSAENWSAEMIAEAAAAAEEFRSEEARVAEGLGLLVADSILLRAFKLMNEAMRHSANGKYDGWRPFQMGFLLASIPSVATDDSDVADVVWFATGGGKTETYLGLIVLAALYGRLAERHDGVVAWSRFPLRMLSLQQTQRFANAMAGAELVRERDGIGGAEFSVGFLVGQGATPNTIKVEAKEWEPDPDDPEMPGRYQVLLRCPFCHQAGVTMAFNRRLWTLEHRCGNGSCPRANRGLPFYVVDEEIFRFLPTVVIGTLDKAALIGFQAGMRSLIGPPWGQCSKPGHGFVYAPRSNRPQGCLVPGCRGAAVPIAQPERYAGPLFRLQDELHLLKDSLGAVDAHYEAEYDDLQREVTGRRAKVLASSATLVGYRKQTDVLYQRSARVFPIAAPSTTEGFWTRPSESTARRFVGVAPRGVTIDYAIDQILTELQKAVRYAQTNADAVAAEASVASSRMPELLSLYGTNIIYGNTLRDLEASLRSIETQIPVQGPLNTATLTGRTDFAEVRDTLARLESPEPDYFDRLHIVAASSMMSHGVDIDRLNVMVMLGLPLATAEFIQATSRVGRRYPGLVFVVHKIPRERDASVFRSFAPFVLQGDRFVEPVPITGRSRRVLDRTISGMAMARILMLHEPASGGSLSTVSKLRQYFRQAGVTAESEALALSRALGLTGALDAPIRSDLEAWCQRFFSNLEDPAGTFQFPSDLSPSGKPMISLRDVEEQAPITGVTD
jgi:hypothetical protein